MADTTVRRSGRNRSDNLQQGEVRSRFVAAHGSAREIYLEVPDRAADWVTEVQLDFVR